MVSFSAQRILLMIGDDGLVAVPHKIPEAPFFVPADSKRGTKELTAFLTRYPSARLTLVVDNLAQDYRNDDLPRLNFLDRAKLASRRLKQAFPSAKLSAVLPFKKSPNRVLLAATHESNAVFAWAERFRDRLPDIALLPVEGARLSAKLMPEAENGWAMMISRQKTGGLRQIVTFKNDLVFTRLTPLPPADSGDETDIIARDIKASIDYLARYGMTNPESLAVLLLMPNDRHLSPPLKNLPLKSVRSLSPFGAAKALTLSLAPKPDDPEADVLFGSFIGAQRRPVLRLMLPDMRAIRLSRLARAYGLRAAAACLLLAISAALWSAGDLVATLLETRKVASQLAETKDTFEKAKTGAAPLTAHMARLREALEKRRIFEQKGLYPWPGINALARSLDADSRLVKLTWKNDLTSESLTVSLRLTTDETNDKAATMAAFGRAAQNIAKGMPDYDVSVLKPPYPSLPDETVTASATILKPDPIGELSIQRNKP